MMLLKILLLQKVNLQDFKKEIEKRLTKGTTSYQKGWRIKNS